VDIRGGPVSETQGTRARYSRGHAAILDMGNALDSFTGATKVTDDSFRAFVCVSLWVAVSLLIHIIISLHAVIRLLQVSTAK
jgi:hypothetical protein